MAASDGLDSGRDADEGDTARSPTGSTSLTLTEALGKLSGQHVLHDVYFLVGRGENQRRIPGHKLILAASSPVFEAMLYPTQFPGDTPDDPSHADHGNIPRDYAFEEDGDAVELPTIALPDLDPDAFETMLQCIYSDKANFDVSTLPSIMKVARTFQLEGLKLACLTFMGGGATTENACTLFQVAPTTSHDPKKTLTFIEDNAKDVIRTQAWLELSRTNLLQILRSDRLALEELQLFLAVLQWAEAECGRQLLDATPENVRTVLGQELVSLIRFPAMKLVDIANHVKPSGVLSTSQLLEVYTYISSPSHAKPVSSFITEHRRGEVEHWSLDPELRSDTVTLKNDNLTAVNDHPSAAYCLGTHSWKEGVHAWRVTRDKATSAPLFLGVSERKTFTLPKLTQPGLWGVSSANQKFTNGVPATTSSDLNDGPIDVLLDVGAGELIIVNLHNNKGHKVSGIEASSPLLPFFYFGLRCPQQVSIMPISLRAFGNKP